MKPEVQQVLTNRDVIAIDQDKAAKQGRRVWQSGDQEIWVRELAGGDRAVAIFNRGAEPANVKVQWASLKIAPPGQVRDLWEHRDEHFEGAEHAVPVSAHGVVMWRVR
jgi:alpha-galactosidase